MKRTMTEEMLMASKTLTLSFSLRVCNTLKSRTHETEMRPRKLELVRLPSRRNNNNTKTILLGETMNDTLTNITIKLPAKDWQKMAKLYGKNRALEVRKAIQALIKKAEERKQ